MVDEKQKKYVNRLLQKYRLPTHKTDYFKDLGLEKFVVFEGVLSPEKSAISPLIAKFLYQHKNLYKDVDVLELGCGTGILAIIIAKCGARKVIATDILNICVKNTQKNSQNYDLGFVLEVRQGDLFQYINRTFDLILFNHPFFYGKPIKGNTISNAILDEGQTIRRFLYEAPRYLSSDGKIITAFSEVAEGNNDPKILAKDYNLSTKVLKIFNTKTGKKYIYELVPEKVRTRN